MQIHNIKDIKKNIFMIQQLTSICISKEHELIQKYFGNIVQENLAKAENIGDYDIELPKRIEEEYLAFLKEVWNENASDDPRTFEEIIDQRHRTEQLTENKRIATHNAYNEAKRISLWERLTKTNHEDVANYKGILKDYTEALLMEIRCDFLEDIGNK